MQITCTKNKLISIQIQKLKFYNKRIKMSAQLLKDLLPQELIIPINQYLGIKSSKYIKQQMYQLLYKKQFIAQEWEQYIQDSKNIIVDLDYPVYHPTNLAVYLQRVLECNFSAQLMDYIQKFCIQTIKNNPRIIYNQYELIKEALPSIDLMIAYLINRTVDNHVIHSSTIKESTIFNILSFVLKNHYVDRQNINTLFYAIRPSQFFTSKTVQTLDLILSYRKQFINGGIVEGYNLAPTTMKIGEQFFLGLFDQFDVSLDYYVKGYSRQYREKNYEKIKVQIETNKKIFKQIIELLDHKHPEFIYQNAQYLSQSATRKDNIELFTYVLQFPHFKQIILTDQCIFNIFRQRKMKYIELIWSMEQYRVKISKIQINDQNILEHVCQSYGLTHNIIGLLWDSGLFQKMPEIKNKKSQKLINKKYLKKDD